jgi:hypothetical protein
MFGIDMISAYLLVIGLLTMFVIVLVWQRHRTERTIGVWLASGVIGLLLGGVGSYAALRLSGHDIHRVSMMPEAQGGPAAPAPAMPGPPAPGMGGMGGMGMEPQPKRDLTTLVRKLDLLTGDIGIALSAEQAARVGETLKDIEKAEALSDDAAKEKHEAILAVLDDAQKAQVDSIGLPRPSRGGPGGPGAGGPGGPGGSRPEPKPNPFQQETEGKSLASLRAKLGAQGDAAKPAKKTQ